MNIKFLIQKLGDCKRKQTSICESISSYEKHNLHSFYIIDDRELHPVRISTNSNDAHLTVKNTQQKDLTLIKLDKCLLGTETQKCDCILYSNTKIFFVELSDCSKGSRNNKRSDAIDQLGTTIEIFKKSNIKFDHLEAKAIICFRSPNRPIRTSLGHKIVEFKSKYKVRLEEKNLIYF